MKDEVDVPQFTPEEIAMLVSESHRLRKKVAVHCHGDIAARDAINAGVDSIEHGSFMKKETLALMKTKGTYLVPTLLASDYIMGKIGAYPQAIQEKAKAATAARSEMFRNAVQIGVKIAFGTDAGIFPHGENAKELALMTSLGMAPIDALRAATLVDAEFAWNFADDRYAGKRESEPTSLRCRAIRRRISLRPSAVSFVMKEGTIVKNAAKSETVDLRSISQPQGAPNCLTSRRTEVLSGRFRF